MYFIDKSSKRYWVHAIDQDAKPMVHELITGIAMKLFFPNNFKQSNFVRNRVELGLPYPKNCESVY